MRIAVIAANGRLGSMFVEEALAAGHSVRAGIRGTDTFTPNKNLTKVECDATDPAQLKKLFAGADVVVSALGHVKGSAADVQTVATKTIIDVMHEMGLERYVDVTGTGVRFPGDKISLVDRALNLAVSVMDPPRVQDGLDHMEVLKASDIDWTTIRVLKLQNVAPKPYELRLNGPTKWYVGRREVAKAMVEVIQDNSFIKRSPIISNPPRS